MERELWVGLRNLARWLDRDWTFKRYRPSDIVVVYWWAVIHDRPVSWAVVVENWPAELRPWLPSQATMSRRVRHPSTLALMQLVDQHFMALHCLVCCWCHCMDGKPLVIGGNSQDPDAGYGRAAGCMAKGYKLHAIWGDAPLPRAWVLTPMNRSEKTIAKELVHQAAIQGYLLADGEYDSNPLHKEAEKAGLQLLARKRKGEALGHRRHSDGRLRSIELLGKKFGRTLYRQRACIERKLGNCTAFGGGLGPLPAWVRRLPRVMPWVYSKLLINAARQSRHLPNWMEANA
jgi:Transposase DDE domain